MKIPEKNSSAAAAPKKPRPMPARLTESPISDLASSISPRTRVETSAMALCTSAPMEGSPAPAGRVSPAGDTLWATGAPPSFGCPSTSGWSRALFQGKWCRTTGGNAPPPPPNGVVGGPGGAPDHGRLVLRRRGRQLVLDHVHDRGVGQRRDVAELPVLRDVAQQTPHDLARSGLGELLDDHDLPGLGDRADVAGHVVAQGLHEFLAPGLVLADGPAQDAERDDALPSRRVAGADDGRLRHGRVTDQTRFHLGGGDPVPRHVHDVVDP